MLYVLATTHQSLFSRSGPPPPSRKSKVEQDNASKKPPRVAVCPLHAECNGELIMYGFR